MSTNIYSSCLKKENGPPFSKENPFYAKIKEKEVLNHSNSSKKTFHISLDISDSQFQFDEGSSVAILPKNSPILVKEFLDLVSCSGTEIVLDSRSQVQMPLKDFLFYKANLSKVSPAFFKFLLQFHPTSSLQELTKEENKEARMHFLASHDVITLLSDLPMEATSPEQWTSLLSPLLPRFYSISSSFSKYPHELHLLVATFSYSIRNQARYGVGSDFLCYHADQETSIPLYIQPSPHFCLPEDPQTPIIMIGAGTGIAPYRAFLQKRASIGNSTQNWLFFGERNQAWDFYYKDELLSYEKQGLLKLTTAFSRDQEQKIYIQHRLEQHSLLLWEWIQQGCCIYLCGDAKEMSKDVTETLLKIFQKEGSMNDETSLSFLRQLRREKRFQADVY